MTAKKITEKPKKIENAENDEKKPLIVIEENEILEKVELLS